MDAIVETPPAAERLNLRVLLFRTDPGRDEPAMLAQELVSDGRPAEAVELTGAALEKDPDDPDLLLTHGVSLARVGQLQTAQLALMRAAQAEPDWPEPWRHLAEVLMMRGKPERALQVADHGLTLEPNDETLTRIRRRLDLEVRARAFVATSVAEEPALLAAQLLDAGRADLAFEVTRTALLEELDDEDLLVVHARAARDRGDLDEALSALTTAKLTTPNWPDIWRLLAEVHEARDELEPALQAAERALGLAPADADLQALHARLRAAAQTLV